MTDLTVARNLISRHFAWDNHSCLPLRAGDEDFIPQLARAKASGFSAVTVNIGFGEQTPEEHLRVLAWFRRWLKRHDDDYLLVKGVADFERARASGRLGVLFDIEGARGIGDELSLIELYRDLGVGWMLIAYNRANLAGSGCYDDSDTGLTPFGRAMIAEMNRVGMIVCCTHTGERTAREAMAASTKPTIFSHSNCATVYPHRRNISDGLIRACADQGGVVGINGIGDFLGTPGADLDAALVAHIDHAVQLVGPQHVGIALDYVYDQGELKTVLATMPELFPDGIPDPLPLVAPEVLPRLVDALLSRGYGEGDLACLLGGSWLRVAQANWETVDASIG